MGKVDRMLAGLEYAHLWYQIDVLIMCFIWLVMFYFYISSGENTRGEVFQAYQEGRLTKYNKIPDNDLTILGMSKPSHMMTTSALTLLGLKWS